MNIIQSSTDVKVHNIEYSIGNFVAVLGILNEYNSISYMCNGTQYGIFHLLASFPRILDKTMEFLPRLLSRAGVMMVPHQSPSSPLSAESVPTNKED